MLVNLKKLNESLEEKYFTESIELDEAFGDMPEWLSKRILTTKYNRNDGQHRGDLGVKKKGRYGGIDRDAIDAKNPEAGPRATYTRARNASRYEDQSLYGQLLAHGINMDSVEVKEGPKPEKRTDGRLKEPNIPIFLFKNGQVYAKGINDNEEYSGDGQYRAFKYVPMKTLLSDEVEKFAYIDGSNDDNFKVTQKRADRAKTQGELSNIPNYYRDKASAGQTNWKGELQYDKSGYRYIPSAQKYRDKLAELKCNKIYDILDEKHQLLEETKEELSNIMLNADLMSMNDEGDDFNVAFKAYDNLYEKFMYAVNYYVECLKRVDNIVNNESYDEKRKKEELAYLINYDSSYRNLLDYTKEIEQLAPKVFNSIIDWI